MNTSTENTNAKSQIRSRKPLPRLRMLKNTIQSTAYKGGDATGIGSDRTVVETCAAAGGISTYAGCTGTR